MKALMFIGKAGMMVLGILTIIEILYGIIDPDASCPW